MSLDVTSNFLSIVSTDSARSATAAVEIKFKGNLMSVGCFSELQNPCVGSPMAVERMCRTKLDWFRSLKRDF